MTISDLLIMFRRRIKIMIVVPIAIVVLVILWSLLVQATYTATATFVTNGDLAFAQGLANSQAASHSNSEVRVSCTSASAAKQVVVSATGKNPDVCIETANMVANEAARLYKESNSSILTTVTEATYAVGNESSVIKNVIMALIAGLFIAGCIVLCIDLIKPPVRSRKDVEDAVGLPVLDEVPSQDGGERLLANLQFRNGERPATVAIVPVGVALSAPVTARELAAALERSDVRVKLVKGSPHARKFQVNVPEDAAIVVSCESLDDGMGAAYIAHSADATIVCASGWKDTKKQLIATVRELELAQANIVGVALLPEAEKSNKPKSQDSE